MANTVTAAELVRVGFVDVKDQARMEAYLAARERFLGRFVTGRDSAHQALHEVGRAIRQVEKQLIDARQQMLDSMHHIEEEIVPELKIVLVDTPDRLEAFHELLQQWSDALEGADSVSWPFETIRQWDGAMTHVTDALNDVKRTLTSIEDGNPPQ